MFLHPNEYDVLAYLAAGEAPVRRGPGDDEPEAPEGRAADTPAVGVALRGLYKRFGDRAVLGGLDLDIPAGQFVAVVGRSGCGKSTLLRLLAGLERPSSEYHEAPPARSPIAFDGLPAWGVDPRCRIMFQDARLLPWKPVLDNVAIGLPPAARRRAAAVLEHVGLGDRAREWPASLSGGQRQRVALARALVYRPRLLLLDEPLGALDALTRIEMQQLIEQLWQEEAFTALLVTHDVSEAVALADRVLVIEDGAIVLDAPVGLPRPRARGSAAFAALEDRILKVVLRQETRAPAPPPPPAAPIQIRHLRLAV